MNDVILALLVIVTVIVFVILVAAIAIKITDLKNKNEPVGNLCIIDDPVDGPQLFLEVTGCSIDHLRKEKIIRLKVEDRGSLN